jgi:hypothetical protein
MLADNDGIKENQQDQQHAPTDKLAVKIMPGRGCCHS